MQTKSVKPFFARYLETSENADLRAQSEVKAGAGGSDPIYYPTKKYPSDGDDCFLSSTWDIDNK